ncbi:MAG: GxxExxY protein [Gemmatimonadales bacterium]
MVTWVSADLEKFTGRLIGTAIAVHRGLGPGFVESVYHRAMEVELRRRGIAHVSELEVDVWYDGVVVGRHRLDMIAEGGVVLEFKAVQSLDPVHFGQLRAYLKATDRPVGLLFNFGEPRLVAKRVLLQGPSSAVRSDPPPPPTLPRFLDGLATSDPSSA